MPLPQDVWENCRRFVRPDESIRYLFPGTASIMGGGAFNVLIMVTDHAVTVLTCTLLSKFRPDAVWGRYPRAVELGPVDFSLGPTIIIGGRHCCSPTKRHAGLIGALGSSNSGGLPDAWTKTPSAR